MVPLRNSKQKNNKNSSQGNPEDAVKNKNQMVISNQYMIPRFYILEADKKTSFPSKII